MATKTIRKLAAIMFTDIVGYTALMGENEPKALQLLEKNRKIQKPLIEIYRGQLLKEMGDGMLASFTSVSDAVHCAQEILRISKEEPDLKLHIGIHLGEVIFSDGDVFGDGVNIASRIESTAKEGEIYISEDVWKNIKNKEDLPVEFVGKKTFKNVKEPVGLYKIKESVSPIKAQQTKTKSINWKKIGIISTFIFIFVIAAYILFNTLNLNSSNQASTSDKSIALLPLQNISDEENDYLANGIQNQIATYLYKIPDIKVYEGTDIEALLAQHMTKDEISKELNLSHILEGSILKEKNRFKLELKLEDLDTDKVVALSYDKNYDLLMDVLSEVAEEVAKSIQIALNAEEKIQFETRPTKSPIAYDLYLRAYQIGDEARKAYNSIGELPFALADSARALALKALEIDPDFMDPQMIIFEYEWGLGNIDTARIIVDNMIKMHPDRWEPYENKAELLFNENKFEESFEFYKKAFDINPNVRYVNYQLGRIYCYIKNDYIKGIPHLLLADQLPGRSGKPRSGSDLYISSVPRAYISIGEYEKALEWSMKELNYFQSCNSIYWIFQNYILQGKYDKSVQFLDSTCNVLACEYCANLYFYYYALVGDFEQAKKLEQVVTSDLGIRLWKAHIAILEGNQDFADKLLDGIRSQLEAYPENNNWRLFDWQLWRALVHAMMGETDMALEWLRKCEKRGFHSGSHDWITSMPVFNNLKDHPEFIAIYQRVQREKAEIRAKIKELEEKGEFYL